MNAVKTLRWIHLTGIAFLAANCAFGEIVAHYTFDDSNDRYKDVTGNGYNGTADGSGTTFASSGIAGLGDAMHTTTSGRVLVNTSIAVALDDFSISFWATGHSDWDNWISFGNSNDDVTLQAYAGSGFMFLNNQNGLPGFSSYGVSASYEASLSHYVLSANSAAGTVTLYVNGEQSAQGAWTVSSDNVFGYLTIGGERHTTDRNIDATIDDVQIYDTALFSGDASYLYASPGSVIPEPATFGLVAFASAIGLLIRRRFTD